MNVEQQAKIEKLSESNVLFWKTEEYGLQQIAHIEEDSDIGIGQRYALMENVIGLSCLLKDVELSDVFILKPVEL